MPVRFFVCGGQPREQLAYYYLRAVEFASLAVSPLK